jgi:type VI secretion system secreted protein Hcp
MATDYFLKIDTIEGESTKKGFEKQIEIESFSWGASQSGAHTASEHRTVGRVDMQSFHFTARMNKSSPKLMLACATGQLIPKAEFTARKADGTQDPYLKWKFNDLIISSYQTNGSAGDGAIPMDSFDISFSKIEVEYKSQTDKGLGAAVTTGYDLKAMQKV